MKYVWTAIRMTIVTVVIAGIVYPLAMTGLAQVVFPAQANGSLIKENGVVIGSSSSARTSPGRSTSSRGLRRPAQGYDAMDLVVFEPRTDQQDARRPRASARSRPTSPPIRACGSARCRSTWSRPRRAARSRHHDRQRRAQAPRVAAARGMSVCGGTGADRRATRPAVELGFLGEPRVNVLQLNLALDAA